jgi:hypothetical protein
VNWRAFGVGAVAAVIVAAAVLVVVVRTAEDGDRPSLGAPPATVSVATTADPHVVRDTAGTIPAIVPLDVDAARLLGDVCAVLTGELRAAVVVDEPPAPDGARRCRAGTGSHALEVELREEAGDPSVASYSFQEQYGEQPRPIGGLPITYQLRQGDRTLVVVFATGVSAWFLVPVSQVDAPLVDAIRGALTG